MSTEEKGPESQLDRAIEEVRSEAVDPRSLDRAADRVWARLAEEAETADAQVETIRNCADFQALIPAWREGRLSEARALLLKDHTHECPACRKALAGVKPVTVLRAPSRRPTWQWAVAAAVIIGTAAGVLYVAGPLAPAPGGVRATVQASDGLLYQVATTAALPAGVPIQLGDHVRTAKGGGAVVRLADGSLVEMRERTELSLTENRKGATIHLAGGSIIVQAAKQHARHLYVATDDCLVSVTGTVFSVNHGLKGSRVAVIEGEVHVEEGRDSHVLRPGDQLATGSSVTAGPLADEFAWSRNVDQYIALMSALSNLQKRLEAAPGPGLRYNSRLLELVPEGTVFYGALPNLGPTVQQANQIFHEQLQQSPVLAQWWAEKMTSGGGETALNDALDRIRAFSDYLGPEIVVAVNAAKQPVVLAEVMHTGFREFLVQQLAKVNAAHEVRIIDDPLNASPGTGKELLIYPGKDLAVASTDLAALQNVVAAAARPGSNPFSSTPFHSQIAQAYTGGVSWLLCADLQPLVKPEAQKSGFDDLRYLVAQHKDAENRALLTFSQARHGAASWLAAPAASRALNYVSADATLAVAAVVKNPAQMLEDISAMSGSDFLSGASEFQAKTGVSVQELAQPLGGEFAFAMDGPVLPVPSWKLIVEVYNPAQFQQTLEKLIAAAPAGQVSLASEKSGGQTFYTLTGPKGITAHYTFQGGFLVAAATTDLVVRALQYPVNGYSLPRSDKFKALLPKDGHVDFSAMVYHSLGTILAPWADKVQLTPEQRKSLEAIAGSTTPVLVLAYGGQDRIELASNGTFFGLSIDRLLGIHGLNHAKVRKGKAG